MEKQITCKETVCCMCGAQVIIPNTCYCKKCLDIETQDIDPENLEAASDLYDKLTKIGGLYVE